MAAIVLDRVSKQFGPLSVIEELSLEIRSGEFLVLVGPSGCGKSTLLRMIAGLEPVTSGRILIDGRPVQHLPPGRRGVAMVFQSYALYPHMTVRDNMMFGLLNAGMRRPEAEARVLDAARRLQIELLLARKPAALSGGQRQRVAIGRAIVKQPKAFLFDEPLSNLDAALRADTRVELAKLHHAVQATMVFVTHDQVEAMTMASRLVVLNAGQVEQVGTPLEVYRRPRNRFVAGFIGSPAMNFIRAEVRDGGIILPGGALFPVCAYPLAAASRVVLGIRPEDARPAAAGGLPATVEVVERLGARTLVHARLRDGAAFAYEDEGCSPVAVGDFVQLRLDPDAAHLFDEAGAVLAARVAEPCP